MRGGVVVILVGLFYIHLGFQTLEKALFHPHGQVHLLRDDIFDLFAILKDMFIATRQRIFCTPYFVPGVEIHSRRFYTFDMRSDSDWAS